MPLIKYGKCCYRYKLVPLYPGVKQINKSRAFENLILLKKILDRHGIPFQLAFGTLLGAIREKDFISHDEDIDLTFLDEDRERFFEILPELNESGFTICRFDRNDLISIMRQGEYIDLYFYRRLNSELRVCSGWVNLSRHITDSTKIVFKGFEFNIPRQWEEYLVGEYGSDWKTPVQWNNYSMNKVNRWLFAMKEHLKATIPRWLFMPLSQKVQQRLMGKCINRLQSNLNLTLSVCKL